ncbi:hypothetical protein BGZ83_009288 [Gryganskiella cystojenkinii]|nr:hypothetical protein BGZ83_009288 [Gryganskiella cystojenkinii]
MLSVVSTKEKANTSTCAIEQSFGVADQETAQAQLLLGCQYQHGDGVPQDYYKALEWYLKAANQGLAIAQYNLGVMYDKGRVVPQDYCKAVKWYSKAANQGYARAQTIS